MLGQIPIGEILHTFLVHVQQRSPFTLKPAALWMAAFHSWETGPI